MQDVGHVLRRKRAQQAQLAKEIELLQTVEEKLREVAPLLADSEEDENAVLAEVDEEISQSAALGVKSAAASAGSQSAAAPSESAQPTRPLALRWP